MKSRLERLLGGSGGIASRLIMGITRVTIPIWFIRAIDLILSPEPRGLGFLGFRVEVQALPGPCILCPSFRGLGLITCLWVICTGRASKGLF